MSRERIGNEGYFALAKQPDPNTIVTPTDFIPIYDESMMTDTSLNDDTPIFGNRFNTYQVLPGIRTHKGTVNVMAEPNTMARIVDMTYSLLSSTGSGPYTRTYGLSSSVSPNSYTVDISTGNIVKRFWGVQNGSIEPSYDNNKMQAALSLSAIGSFQGREIASVSGSGPYTVSFKTDYDQNPTKGLVAGDLIRFYDLSAGTSIDATVASVASGTSITTSTNPTAIVASDMLHLRPATVSFNTLTPFLWAKTEFRQGLTAAAALSAVHTPLEPDSGYTLINSFESEDGSPRSGSFDPAALVRTTGGYTFTTKKFFDTPEDVQYYLNLAKSSWVVRHFSGSSNQYEMRVTMNHLKAANPLPGISAGDVNYSEIVWHPQYDQPDGQGMLITIINALATV